MLQFSLPDSTTVVILGVNLRSEKHGKIKVPALDVKVSLVCSNMMLDQLKAELRDALYIAVADDEVEQPELDGVEPLTDTPLLRVQGMDPVHLQDEFSGYTATFDLGLGGPESVVELSNAKVGGFVIEAMQGGSVRIVFKIQAAHVGKREMGELGVLIDCEASLQLEPPRVLAEPIDGSLPLVQEDAAWA